MRPVLQALRAAGVRLSTHSTNALPNEGLYIRRVDTCRYLCRQQSHGGTVSPIQVEVDFECQIVRSSLSGR